MKATGDEPLEVVNSGAEDWIEDTKPGGVMGGHTLRSETKHKSGIGNGERSNAEGSCRCNDCRPKSPVDLCICGPKTRGEHGCLCAEDQEPNGRTFDTGATRDTEHGKYDYEGFLSPLVLERFAEYMDKHRTQADGTLRSSDNWQKGIPKDAYMKSLTRHFIEVWKEHRLFEDSYDEIEEALCAVVFNAMGYLYEIVKPCR